ncbi:MAG: M20/M25/M40 family metallo-hydrolase [Myxococcota bacterium]|nr:M20/M25/M40 family metallo-hydrolase [Myxococcota bacterium]
MTSPWILLTALSGFAEPPDASAPQETPLAEDPLGAFDWEAASDEAVQVLSAYLQVDTRNPGPFELQGATFLGERLAAEGIPYEIEEYAPGRANLMARLPGDGSAGGPLCLLSHIDVVPWEAERWEGGPGPLSGAIEDGYVWGRGALDMKGMGVLELQGFIWLKRLGVPLRREVILLAVADEEVDNGGARHLAEHRWDELNCAYVFNEGGMGVQDLLFDGQTIYPVSVGEKGVLWVRLNAQGEPGHGSTPVLERESPERLLQALDKVREHNAAQPLLWHPAMYELLNNAGLDRAGLERTVLTSPKLATVVLDDQLSENPVTRASMTTTWHVTGLEGARAPNIVPGVSSAVLDIRLYPGHSVEQALADLEGIIGDPLVEIEVISQEEAGVSEWQGDPVYAAMVQHLTAGREHVVAGPAISPGFTDSIYLRAKGARAYGLVPFEVAEQELTTFHGPKERISVQNVERGMEWMLRVLWDVAGPGAPQAPTAE